MIEVEERGPVSILRMKHGKANALDTDLLRSLQTVVRAEVGNGRGIVLTGTDQFFSAGVDLPRLLDGGADYALELISALHGAVEELARFPRPVVAAVNGHAIAGGFVLACACDLRLVASGPAKLGLTELLVGVPFPSKALAVVRWAIGDRLARELVYHARLYSAAEAADKGLVDGLTDAEDLQARAIAAAEKLSSLPAPAFEISKRQLQGELWARPSAAADELEAAIHHAWTAPETLDRVRRFVNERLG